ncbi:MAG: hypothetical protein AB7Q42_16040 [Acidimicrobiia bacterium]
MPLGTPKRRMPIPEDVRDFLADLLGKPVSVSKATRIDLEEEPESFVTGVYVEDDGKLGGACIAGLTFAASAGAALAMMPVVVAKEAISAGELPESLHDNFYEVANIMSSILNGPSVPHLRITSLVPGIPDEVRTLAANAAGRKHYDVTIVDYVDGKMVLLAA